MEKEQTTFDVQIGDGMDIGIMGENGDHPLKLYHIYVEKRLWALTFDTCDMI